RLPRSRLNSAPEQSLELVETRVARATLPRLLPALPRRLVGGRLLDAQALFERAADALAGLRLGEVGRRRGIVDLVLHGVERADQVHRDGKTGKLLQIGATLAL